MDISLNTHIKLGNICSGHRIPYKDFDFLESIMGIQINEEQEQRLESIASSIQEINSDDADWLRALPKVSV